jgi:hypothetical protein
MEGDSRIDLVVYRLRASLTSRERGRPPAQEPAPSASAKLGTAGRRSTPEDEPAVLGLRTGCASRGKPKITRRRAAGPRAPDALVAVPPPVRAAARHQAKGAGVGAQRLPRRGRRGSAASARARGGETRAGAEVGPSWRAVRRGGGRWRASTPARPGFGVSALAQRRSRRSSRNWSNSRARTSASRGGGSAAPFSRRKASNSW